jgi:hypothetical protein
VSRIWNSDTGHVVVVIGGLYTYGTEAAGKFLTKPQFMQEIARAVPLADPHRNLQIVLATTVTDDAAGPPRNRSGIDRVRSTNLVTDSRTS